jgi:hypothetical protein
MANWGVANRSGYTRLAAVPHPSRKTARRSGPFILRGATDQVIVPPLVST